MLGKIQGPFHTGGTLGFHSGGCQIIQITLPRLFWQKKQPSPSVTSHLPCPSSSLPFQGLLSSLLSFVKSITRKGKKKKKKELQWNKTKTFNNFDIGAQHLYLSPRGPGWGRAGWPFSTGSAFAPRCRKRAKEKPSP